MLAVRMFARLEQSLQIRLPLATLFEAPTIEGLADVIRAGGHSAPAPFAGRDPAHREPTAGVCRAGRRR